MTLNLIFQDQLRSNVTLQLESLIMNSYQKSISKICFMLFSG